MLGDRDNNEIEHYTIRYSFQYDKPKNNFPNR